MAVSFSRLLLATLAFSACSRPPVPARLAGLSRTKLVGGSAAVAMLSRLHGGRLRPPKAMLAEYGHGRLSLYVALYATANEAQQVVEKMAQSIARSREFSAPRFFRPEERRWLTIGLGGSHHLFWRSEQKVFWLTGEPEVLFLAIQQLPPPPMGLLI